MKLRRLRLKQVGVFDQYETSFGDGLIGIFGPQGSGKSTLLNSAYTAITGDYSRFEGGKAGIVRQQAEPVDISEIHLFAEHGGRSFEVQRVFQPSDYQLFKFEDSDDKLRRKSEIASAINALLDGPPDLLKRYVFVEQWQLRELVTLRDADRAKALARLCRTDHAEVCWSAIGRQLESDKSLAVAAHDNSDELRREIVSATKAMEQAKARLDSLVTEQLDAETLKVLKDSVRDYETAQTDRQRLSEERERLPGLKQIAAEALRQREAAVREHQEASERLEELKKSRDDLKAARDQQLEQQRAFDDRAKAVAAAKEAHTAFVKWSPPAKPECDETEEEAIAMRDRLLESRAPFLSIIQQFGELQAGATEGVCPTCKQPVRDPLQQLERARQDLKPLDAELSRVRDVIKVWERYRHDLQVAKQNRDRLARDKKAKEAELAKLPPVVTPGPVIARDEVIAAERLVTAQAATLKALGGPYTEAINAESRAAADVRSCEANIKRLGKPAAAISQKTYNESRAMISRHDEVTPEIAKLETRIELYADNIAQRQQDLDAIQKVVARTAGASEWLRLLAGAQALLHRDALPRVVHEAAMRHLETEINELLELFETPFHVRTSGTDLNYVAYFHNGTVMPAPGLSGGQQVVLSLAARWALNSQFAGQIGMLALDEPTAGLDRRHVELFCGVLSRLGAIAKNSGYQIFMNTHEDALRDVCDQVIQLDRPIS